MMLRAIQILSISFLALLGPAKADAGREPKDLAGVVRVFGEGHVLRTPDLAVVRLTVLRQSEEAGEAVTTSNEAVRTVISALAALDIQRNDIQSADFQITPRFNFNGNGGPEPAQSSSAIVGYDVRNTLMVRIKDVSRVGAVLDAALKNGVNEGGSVELMVEDLAGAVDEARANAVQAAMKSAAAVAKAAGFRLGGIITIEDQLATTIAPYASADARLRSAASDGGVPIEFGRNVVTARVAVSYWLEKER